MHLPTRRADIGALAATALLAFGFTFGVLRPSGAVLPGLPSYDLYAAHYPNVVYALRSLREGHGLLWNALQNCGQPFIPSTLLGLFYPLHLIFLAVDIDTGFLLLAALHLTIGGIGSYLLARQYGARPAAAFCGAASFLLSGSVLTLTTWLPSSILGIYVWIPFAFLFCERIIAAPSMGDAVGLGVVLTLELLPGYPQILVYTYQLLALRVVWELATTRMNRPFRVLAALGLGMALPAALGAIQLLPMAEFASESLRNRDLASNEMNPAGQLLTWEAFRTQLGQRGVKVYYATFSLIGFALAVPALLHPRQRRLASFYVLAAVLFVALAFQNTLAEWYQMLPLGRAFREPWRTLWMIGFLTSVAVALGSDTVMSATDRRSPRLPLALLLGAAALSALSPTWLPGWEWALFGALVAAALALPLSDRAAPIVRAIVAALLVIDLVGMGVDHALYFHDGATELYQKRGAFDFVKQRMTPQDRIYQFGRHLDFAIMSKSPSVFGVPGIGDYEPQTSRRFADLTVFLLGNHTMNSINEFLFPIARQPRNLNILNLFATRYLLVARDGEPLTPKLAASLRLITDVDGVAIYENPAALPRAYYVGRLGMRPRTVTPDLLGLGRVNPRQIAMIEAVPADGTGTAAPNATGNVTFVTDRSEEVVLSVSADQAGFVVLSDQYYPGWIATVNDVEAPILRVNHAFRAVHVPAGESTVAFRYRPRSVRLGALVSALTLGSLLVFAVGSWWARSRRRPAP